MNSKVLLEFGSQAMRIMLSLHIFILVLTKATTCIHMNTLHLDNLGKNKKTPISHQKVHSINLKNTYFVQSFFHWGKFGKVDVLEKWMVVNCFCMLNLISLLITKFVGTKLFFPFFMNFFLIGMNRWDINLILIIELWEPP